MSCAENMQQQRCWIALSQAPSLGPVLLDKLIHFVGSPEHVLQAGSSAWREWGLPDVAIEALVQYSRKQGSLYAQVERSVQWLDHPNHSILLPSDEHYPRLIKEAMCPPVLFLRGKASLLHSDQCAVVGSRNASPAALKHSFDFAAALAKAGITVTSGLALGIDGQAHAGALSVQGNTIAVLGCGLDRIYPRRHGDLTEAIAEQGLLVSEFAPGTPPLAGHFPRRNRIISGLSLGVLVVEAAMKSGSLITARLAVEQNREVFAVPGSVGNVMAKGCHWLIKQGATLVESADDILEALPEANMSAGQIKMPFDDELNDTEQVATESEPLSAQACQLKALLGQAMGVDQLIIELQGPPPERPQ